MGKILTFPYRECKDAVYSTTPAKILIFEIDKLTVARFKRREHAADPTVLSYINKFLHGGKD